MAVCEVADDEKTPFAPTIEKIKAFLSQLLAFPKESYQKFFICLEEEHTISLAAEQKKMLQRKCKAQNYYMEKEGKIPDNLESFYRLPERCSLSLQAIENALAAAQK